MVFNPLKISFLSWDLDFWICYSL